MGRSLNSRTLQSHLPVSPWRLLSRLVWGPTGASWPWLVGLGPRGEARLRAECMSPELWPHQTERGACPTATVVTIKRRWESQGPPKFPTDSGLGARPRTCPHTRHSWLLWLYCRRGTPQASFSGGATLSTFYLVFLQLTHPHVGGILGASSQSCCPDPPPTGAVDSTTLGPVRELVRAPRRAWWTQSAKHSRLSPSLWLLNRVPVDYGPWKFTRTLQVFGAPHKMNKQSGTC